MCPTFLHYVCFDVAIASQQVYSSVISPLAGMTSPLSIQLNEFASYDSYVLRLHCEIPSIAGSIARYGERMKERRLTKQTVSVSAQVVVADQGELPTTKLRNL